eukprot:515064-Prorocentrum_minimum.AAC.1
MCIRDSAPSLRSGRDGGRRRLWRPADRRPAKRRGGVGARGASAARLAGVVQVGRCAPCWRGPTGALPAAGSSCADNGKDALNTPETLPLHTHIQATPPQSEHLGSGTQRSRYGGVHYKGVCVS